MRFDNTESAHTDRKIEDLSSGAEMGKVTNVREHTSDDDSTNFEVDVFMLDSEKTRRNVPVLLLVNGFITPPKLDDTVLVLFLDSQMESEAPVVLGHVPTVQNRPPKGKAGTFRAKRGNLYIEMDADGETARIAKKSDDTESPTSKVEVDDSGSSTVVNIEAEGDVIINSSNGNVVLGGTSGKPVARKGDSVSGSTSDGASFDGTIDSGSDNVDSA